MLSSSFIIILISLSWLSLSSLLLLLITLSPSKLNELHYPKYHLEFNSGNKLVFTFIFRKLFSILTQTVMSTSKLRWKVYMRRNQQLGCTPIGKKEIKIFFYGYSRYTAIFYLNQQSQIENLNNLQKQEIFKTENSKCGWTHSIGKTILICCYWECLSAHHKKILSFCLILYSYNPWF